MLRGWFDSTFGNGSLLAQVVVVITLLVLVLAVLAWLFGRRKSGGVSRGPARGRQPRLSVMEAAIVDSKRRLVLVRRDQIEHLVMIGGPTDIVVETNIVRGRPAGLGHPGRRPVPGSRPQQQAPAVPGHQMPPAGAAIASSAAATAAAVLRHPAGNSQADPVSEFRRGSGNGSAPLVPAAGSRPVSHSESAPGRHGAALDISADGPVPAHDRAGADLAASRNPAVSPPESAAPRPLAAVGQMPEQAGQPGSVAFAGLAAGAAALAAAAGNKSRKTDGETVARSEPVETAKAAEALKVTTPPPIEQPSEIVQPATVEEIAAVAPPSPAPAPEDATPVSNEPEHGHAAVADPDPLGDLESEFEKAFETSLQDLTPVAETEDKPAAADEAVADEDTIQTEVTRLETVEPEEIATESEESVLVTGTVAEAPADEPVEEIAEPEEPETAYEHAPAETDSAREVPEVLDDEELTSQPYQFQSVTELPPEAAEDEAEPADALDDEMEDSDEPAIESMAPMTEEMTVEETAEAPASEVMVALDDTVAPEDKLQADETAPVEAVDEAEPADAESEIDLDYLEASLSDTPAAPQSQPETAAGEDVAYEVTVEAEPEPVAEAEAEVIADIPEAEAEELELQSEREQAPESWTESEVTTTADVEPESEAEPETEAEAKPDNVADAEAEEERSPSGLPAELAFLDQPATTDDMEAEIEPPVAEAPAPPKPAAKSVNPFPTIPDNVRKSVMEAARRAVSPEVAEGIATGANTDVAATTLGDLAQRLEKALSEQASSKSAAPASSLENVQATTEDEPLPAEAKAEIEEDEAADETERAVIDFNARRRDEPDPEDALEDEMARLLNDLTGDTNRVG